jgi:hypothetical protein
LAVSWLYYVKGRNDTACFAIVDGDWQVIPTAFEGWLAPGNFDAAGSRRLALGELTP